MEDRKAPPTAQCNRCGHTMKLDRRIPKLGPHPELLVFICPSCKEVETMEQKQVP
jgi:hypothetical protein